MRPFDINEYMQPMYSKPGMISSRKNKYFLRAISKFYSNNLASDPVPEFPKLSKLPNLHQKSKKIKITGSYSFKTVARAEKDSANSPPPNQYSPKYEFLYKKTPSFVFSKQKTRERPEGRSKTSEPFIEKNVESPQKIQGIPFDKQIPRREMPVRESPHEKRFEMQPFSSFDRLEKVRSFADYTGRKPLYESFEYQPEYSPKYNFVSKHFKLNKLVD